MAEEQKTPKRAFKGQRTNARSSPILLK